MIIPIQELSADVLYSVAESYVLREGTDYGAEEVSLDTKVQQVIAKLRSGEAVLVYSELYESVNIVDAQEYQE
ncbi:MAG TPA: hypothetical protein DCE62_06810 [Glaciecola sp.]|jgi:hypothetical protein|nr:YheU family protein [Glaciecola sp.]HAB79977.1 hypothetical protein [Glaciecola sp.]HAQ49816.1 hypothetical protein [Glaciecola sp.]HCF79694.1 hypothetical protein [Glaciecola sp.]